MSAEPEIKRWKAKRKAVPIREIYKGQTTVPEAVRVEGQLQALSHHRHCAAQQANSKTNRSFRVSKD